MNLLIVFASITTVITFANGKKFYIRCNYSVIYKNQNLTLNDKYKKCLFATGSILEHLMPRAEEDCQAYLKPGVTLKEEMAKYVSGCCCDSKCNKKCTKLDIWFDGKSRCEASDDCKEAIKSNADMWNEEKMTNHFCLVGFNATKYMNNLCNNQ